MSKNLYFGGKTLNIAGGSRVVLKSDSNITGQVQNIKFDYKGLPTMYLVKFDSGKTQWVKARLIKPI